MRKNLFTLFLFILFATPVLADDETAPARQLGYLDNGPLLSGQAENWKADIDTLARLGFDYIGTRSAGPAGEVQDYLENNKLAVRHVIFPDQEDPVDAGKSPLRVLGENARKTWTAETTVLPEGNELLWPDEGAGEFANWPSDKRGFRIGVLLHAGNRDNGPVQDPYPPRIGESLAETAERGLDGNVLVAAPRVDVFLLNLEAAAAAHRAPGKFDADAFYTDWMSRRFGKESAVLAVKSMKLLHGAHEAASGFVAVSRASLDIIADLDKGTFRTIDMNPVNDAMRLASRSRTVAEEAAVKVPANKRDSFNRIIIRPAAAYEQNLLLLESVSELSNAWKIYRAFPSPVSRQRVDGLVAEAQARATALRTVLAETPGGETVRTPSPETIEALSVKLEAD
jgi:hypothetical protein